MRWKITRRVRTAEEELPSDGPKLTNRFVDSSATSRSYLPLHDDEDPVEATARALMYESRLLQAPDSSSSESTSSLRRLSVSGTTLAGAKPQHPSRPPNAWILFRRCVSAVKAVELLDIAMLTTIQCAMPRDQGPFVAEAHAGAAEQALLPGVASSVARGTLQSARARPIRFRRC